MFSIKIDKPWLEKEMEALRKEVPHIIKRQLGHAANGVICDMVKQAIVEELQKPEYKEQIKEIAKKLISDREAERLVKEFLFRRY